MPNQSCMDDALVRPIEELRWNNGDNSAFYESLKIDGLKTFAEKAGLAGSCDMEALSLYWSQAKSILEVGAGYGRIIDYLLKRQFTGRVTAVERCKIFSDYLYNQYNNCKNVRLIFSDILHFDDINDQFDLILMLWSGFSEFSLQEQEFLLRKFSFLLSKGGVLIVDTMPTNITPLLAEKYGRQFYVTKIKKSIIYTYEPDIKQVSKHAKQANFFIKEKIVCETDIGRKRWLYVLN